MKAVVYLNKGIVKVVTIQNMRVSLSEPACRSRF